MKIHHIALLIPAIALLNSFPARSQTVIFQEGFETSGTNRPEGWTEEKVRGVSIIPWIFQTGGGIGEGRAGVFPDSAAVGTYNAVFGYQSSDREATKLITPPINLTGRSKPELRFWHVQMTWTWFGQNYWDQLKVSYKHRKAGKWYLLESYPSAVEAWTYRVIQIPDSALTDSIYIAFEGTTYYGNGTCIDDVKLVETGILPRAVSSLSVKQASTMFVASGLKDNPVLRVDVNVIGNQGSCTMQSLTLKTNNSDNSDISPGGVRLYYTTDTIFNNLTPLLGGMSINLNQVSFTGINKNLAFGSNSFWLTYDIADTAKEGHTVDMYIPANGITIQSLNYPSSKADPPGNRPILNKIYYNGFETDSTWGLYGDFQWTNPRGLGGLLEFTGTTGGTPDPENAFGGSKIIGNDLTGLGYYKGNYETNVSEPNINYAISPTLDLRFYKNINLNFQRWLNVYQYDFASIDVTTDNGASWTPVWTNMRDGGGTINDSKWESQLINISSYVERKNNVKLRFTLGPTADIRSYCGWNIDDVLALGDFITRDVGVIQLTAPHDGCGLSSAEPVSVILRNFGYNTITDPIPVSYTFDGGAHVVNETITHDPLPSGDTLHYTFITKADLSNPDVYNQVEVRTNLTGDEESSNDLIDTVIYSLPYSSLPYYDGFEQNISFWRSSGKNSTWGHGTPNSFRLTSAYAGAKAWKTNLTNYYLDNDSSYVESPCLNMTGILKPIFEFKMWRDIEPGSDGARLEYSTNGGSTWRIVPSQAIPQASWIWYNDPHITALNSAGWDSISDWVTAKQFLPDSVAGKSLVKFRFHFASDSITTFEGFAFDEVKVYEAPIDIGAHSFRNLQNNCQYLNSNYISFYVKNFGYIPIKTGQKIIAGMKVNNNPVIVDTFSVASNIPVGDSVWFQFTKPTNLDEPGNYKIKVWTMSEPDPLFYHPLPNDTVSRLITIYPLPTVGLPDTLRSSMPDTIVLRATNNINYDYYWLSNGSTASTLHIPGRGTYIVRVSDTRGNGCQTYDTTVVQKLILDVGVDSLLSPNSACSLTNTVHPAIRIHNFGTDTLSPGTIIPLNLKIATSNQVRRNLVLSQKFYPGVSLSYTFADTSFDMSSKGTYAVSVATSFKYDSIASNNSQNQNIEVYGFPKVNIGPDTLISGLTYQLDAGPGFKTYLWNNGDTTRTYVARFLGNHWVTVTDYHNCPASDTAFIHLVIHDIGVSKLENPVSSCTLPGAQKISILIENMGTDTLLAGMKVNLGYSIGNNNWLTDSIVLPGDLYPQKSISHQFTKTEHFDTTGDYVVKMYSVIQGDINPENDTLIETASFWESPSVNLGADQILRQLSYTLDAGAGANLKYTWSTGDTTRNLVVTKTGYYNVKVTDVLHGCYDRDTVNIILIIDDLGILAHDPDTIFCSNYFRGIGITIKNFGNANYAANKKIPVMYRLNGGTISSDTAVTTGWLYAEGTLHFMIDNFKSVPPAGLNTLLLYTKTTGDLRTSNDTMNLSFVVYNSPAFSLGGTNDTIRYSSSPYALDAGNGYSSYIWNTGSIGQIIYVSSDGWYKATVTDANSCAATDSVFMYFFNGMDNLQGNKNLMHVFPNPASAGFTLQTELSPMEDYTLEIINTSSEVVLTRRLKGSGRSEFRINTQDLPRGVYFLRMLSKESVAVEKIILK